MTIEKVQYHKVFNLGDYQNEKIGIEITLSAGDDPVKVFYDAKQYVEKAHAFMREMPKYKRAQEITADPNEYTGRQVSEAAAFVADFEKNFADHLQIVKQKQIVQLEE